MKNFRSSATFVKSAGFTIPEMMITLLIVAILAAIGVPSFNSLIQKQRLTTTVNDFFSAINLTRAEAVKRNGRVDLAPLDGKDWSNGWAVFVDSDSDQVPDASKGDTIIFQFDGKVPDGIIVTSNLTSTATEPGKAYIPYTATGRTRTNASLQLPQAGTITFTQGSEIRRIKINFLGRARVCNPVVDTTTCGATSSD